MTPEARQLKAVIVDDEPPARALLKDFLSAHADIDVVAECANGFEAVKRIGETSPELVFLDVQMPKLDGFEVLELLDPGPLVIFVTAYDEYALKAFEVNAVDYLLKPFGRERLAEALGRARSRIRQAQGKATSGEPRSGAPEARARTTVTEHDLLTAMPDWTSVRASALAAAARPAGHFVERILIKDGVNVHVVPLDRVDLFEAQDDYVAIHSEGKTHLKTQALSDLASGLDPARFVRVHRSYVVNLERIARLETYAKDSRVAVLKDGREIPVSRSGYTRLKELM